MRRRIFLLFGIICVFWTAYRYFVQFPEWADEFIAKPLLQVLPVLLTVLFIEKQPLGSLSVSSKKPVIHILIGLGLGAILVIESSFMKIIRHAPMNTDIMALILPFFVSAATGFTEELIYRGYFTNRLIALYDHVVVANLIQTLLFVLIHVPITVFVLHYSLGDSLVYAGQIAILGFAYGLVFLQTESIVPSAIAHAMWNFSNVLFR